VVRDRAALHVKDAEDRATLVERETIERVSRVDVENDTALASAREDVEGFVRKITLLEGELATKRRVLEGSEREHRERFEELTLLQTRALSYAMPWSVPHEGGITCLMGCGMRPFAILKWPESLPSRNKGHAFFSKLWA
jgi:hypothetical protein